MMKKSPIFTVVEGSSHLLLPAGVFHLRGQTTNKILTEFRETMEVLLTSASGWKLNQLVRMVWLPGQYTVQVKVDYKVTSTNDVLLETKWNLLRLQQEETRIRSGRQRALLYWDRIIAALMVEDCRRSSHRSRKYLHKFNFFVKFL